MQKRFSLETAGEFNVRCRICNAKGVRSEFATSNLCMPCQRDERKRYRKKYYRPVEHRKQGQGKGKWKNRPSKEGDPAGASLSAAFCTLTQWDELQKECKGYCMICGEYKGSGLHLDHDHKTSQVRGLLCARCNVGLGQFGDDEAGLLKALEYLRRRTAQKN